MGGCRWIHCRKSEWAELAVDWGEVLRRHNVASFHFSEYADVIYGPEKPNWPYKGWDADKRLQYLLDLATVANKYTKLGVAAMVHVPSYYRIMPQWYRDYCKTPYALCLKVFLTRIWGHVQEQSFELQQSTPDAFFPAAFVFDHVDDKSQNEWYYLIGQLFDEQKTRTLTGIEGSSFSKLINSITVSSRNALEPTKYALEAADLLAGRARQVMDRFPKGTTLLDDRLSTNISIYQYDGNYLHQLAYEVEKDKDACIVTRVYDNYRAGTDAI